MLRKMGEKPTDLEEISNFTFLDKLVMDNQEGPRLTLVTDSIWPGFINRDKYLEIHQRVSLVTATQYWPGIIGIGTWAIVTTASHLRPEPSASVSLS